MLRRERNVREVELAEGSGWRTDFNDLHRRMPGVREGRRMALPVAPAAVPAFKKGVGVTQAIVYEPD